jgi:magnesium chelatase family protein
MDLLVTVVRPAEHELRASAVTDSTRARQRVALARERQRVRLAGTRAACNGDMDVRLVRSHVCLDEAADRVLTHAYTRGVLSARGRHRVLRVARTIADLEESDTVRESHLLTALGLRQRTSAETTLVA